MTRVEFSTGAIGAIVLRATGARGRVHCEKCGAHCPTRADYQIDHCTPEGVRPTGRPRQRLRAEDGRLLCIICHANKTRRDVAAIAKTNRIRDKHRTVSDAPTEIARRYGVKQETEK